MALVAERWGLIPELRQFAAAQRPIWGTCAGLIFLANRASGQCVPCGCWARCRSDMVLAGQRACAQGRVWPPPAHVPPRRPAAPPAAGMKEGGQALLGGLDVMVQRNFFGAQVCEGGIEQQWSPEERGQGCGVSCIPPTAPTSAPPAPDRSTLLRRSCRRRRACRGVPTQTARAARRSGQSSSARQASPRRGRVCAVPAAPGRAAADAAARVTLVGGCSSQPAAHPLIPFECPPHAHLTCAGVEVLAEYQLTAEEAAAAGRGSVVVAVRSGHLMATAFHPELTQDARWHELFVQMVQQHAADAAAGAPASDPWAKLGRTPNRPADLPVY